MIGVPPGLRVLLVEDEPANRALVRATVGHAGRDADAEITLHEATSLAEARTQLAVHAVDIVLLDVRLPDGSGLDLVPELRGPPGGSRPRVIILSASVLPSEEALARASGAADFLGKPFRPADLLAILQGSTG